MADGFFVDEIEGEIRFQKGARKLTLFQGDICQLKADAIVCPVDCNLDFRNGVARVISQAAGEGIRNERPLFPEPYGKVVVLPGGNLKSKYIFLTVLLGQKSEKEMRASIRQAVERTLRYAEFLRLKNIAFPVLGSPQSKIPYAFIAREMLLAIRQYFQKRNVKLDAVLFSVFNTDALDAFRKEVRLIASL